MSSLEATIEQYLATCEDLQKSFGDMSQEQLLARPVEGKWTSMEVLCHLVDTELMMSARIRAALIADKPRQLGLSTEELVGMHFWQNRGGAEEIALFASLRMHTAQIVRGFPGDPSERQLILIKPDGKEVVRAVGELLTGVTRHAPPHLVHVQEKRAKLGLPTNFSISGLDA